METTTYKRFDNFNASSQEEISQKWAQGLTYKGLDLYKFLWEQNGMDKIDQNVTAMFSDSQECFLAYFPKTDYFISGYDAWGAKNYSEDSGAVVLFKITEANKVIIISAHSESEMIYSEDGLCNRLENEEKDTDVIFIRLD